MYPLPLDIMLVENKAPRAITNPPTIDITPSRATAPASAGPATIPTPDNITHAADIANNNVDKACAVSRDGAMLSFDITPRITAIPTTANSIVPRAISMLPLAIAGTTLINAKAAAIVPNKRDNDSAEAKAFSTGSLPIIAIIPPSITTAPDKAIRGARFTPLVKNVDASISANIPITD